MKLQPRPPTWLPSMLHLAHGLVAFGAGYLLAHAAVLYNAAAPGSASANFYLAAAVGLALFEIGYFAYFIARRRKLRNLWREAGQLVKAEQFEAAKLPLTELLNYSEYRLAPQPVLFALGACEEGLGHQREALILYRRCGDYEAAVRAIGMLQLERGFNEAAAEALRKLVARRPQDLISVVLLALALVRGGHRDAATRALKRALEQRPKSEMLLQNLSRVESGEEPAMTIERKAK